MNSSQLLEELEQELESARKKVAEFRAKHPEEETPVEMWQLWEDAKDKFDKKLKQDAD